LVQFLGRDKVYGVEDPGYQKPSMIYESCGAKCVPLPMDGSGVRPDALEASPVSVLHISPSHHFPTGIVMPVSRRYELLSWCSRQEGRYILEDDYDCEFRTGGKPIPTLQSIDASDRVIYLNTFSKTLASTMRISYLVLPPSLVKPFQEKLGFYACTVSSFEQLALARFIREGYFEKHLNRMRNRYKAQKNRILQLFKTSPIAERIQVHMEKEGLHFLLEVKNAPPDDVLVACAREQGLRISCLSQYYHSQPPRTHMIVFHYAGLPAQRTQEAVQRLIKSLEIAFNTEQ
jgi:GntR family transcriptional regulator/MocR family aminotransferase